jgi:hypothetical protein
MIHNSDSLRAEINNNNSNFDNKFDNMQALNDAARMEMLELIDQRSRRSTRASSRTTSRAVSPKTLIAQVSAKLEPRIQEPPVTETPRVNSFGADLTITQVFRDKDAADNFEEENNMRRQRAPKVSKRDNTHAYRDSYNATHRPNDPLKTESFTRTTPECKAKLDGPLTLEKCLEFQKYILDFQNKYNVEVRHTSYLFDELKAEMKARFDLTDCRFYTMTTQDFERFLSEMIAPVCKFEFLSMPKDTVHITLPQGFIPTEQTLTTFLYQLLVYKERMFRAIEFILLYDSSDACLPACDTKPQGLLKLISDEVPHRFIELILQSDPPGTEYSNIYKFFTRVAIHTKRCETLHREAKFFRASFGGSKFEKAQRDALASSSSTSQSASRYDKATPTITTEASIIKPPVPFSNWTPRAPRAVVAVMKAVDEVDDEESTDENDEPIVKANDESSIIPTKHDSNISALTASEMLTKACYRHVTKNYCGISNCGYSHDPGIIAVARDQQIIDLTNAKRDMQAGHQAVMKTFEKQGAKVFKRDSSTAERRPQNPDSYSHLALLWMNILVGNTNSSSA